MTIKLNGIWESGLIVIYLVVGDEEVICDQKPQNGWYYQDTSG